MAGKLKPSTKVYERDARGKITNKWTMQHHTPSSITTKELKTMYEDAGFSRKKQLIKRELKKRGVIL